MKTPVWIVGVVAIMFCAVAFAQEFETAGEASTPAAVTCQKGSLSRIVEVTYESRQGEPPCEVHYRKTVELPGHDEILWSAENTKNYCETKQQQFVAKLESWGWNCR